jgi:putative hydrolase of the HAD superfamily
MSRPRALIFDYSGVITVPLSIASLDGGPTEGEPTSIQKLATLMRHELDNPDPNGLWNRLERGETPLTELLETIDDVVPGASVFFAGHGAASLMSALKVRADVIDRLAMWREQGVAMALLTNNVKEWRPLWMANLEAAGGAGFFDVIIDSSEVGMRKPEARIYTHTVEVLGQAIGIPLALKDCLFVDDFVQNVDGATAVGLPALLATTDDAHWAEMDRLFAE